MKRIFYFFVVLFVLASSEGNAQVGWQWGCGQSSGDSTGLGDILSCVVDKRGNFISCGISTYSSALFDTCHITGIGSNHECLLMTKVDSTGHYMWAFQSKWARTTGLSTVCDTLGNIYVYGSLSVIVATLMGLSCIVQIVLKLISW